MKPNIYSFLVFLLLLAIPQCAKSFSVESKTGQGRGRTQRFVAAPSTRTALTDETSTRATTLSRQSVIRPGIKADTRVWNNVCPGVFENARGVDVRLNWKKDSKAVRSALAERVASAMLEQIIGGSVPSSPETKSKHACLAASLEAFMAFCEEHLKQESFIGYSARLVATRGSPSTKCPAWHQDHVPVRWIQSLVGPGCQWVELSDWVAADESDDASSVIQESVEEMNQRRVDTSVPVHQASPGEAVLLVGRSWSEFCIENQNLPAVVHRSPSGFLPWQPRILLTMDLLTMKDEGKQCV